MMIEAGARSRRMMEIMDAAGGGVRVLPARANLLKQRFSKRPIVYDTYRFPQVITNGTFQQFPTCTTFNKPLKTKVLTYYFNIITFHTHHFYNLTRPLENTTQLTYHCQIPNGA